MKTSAHFRINSPAWTGLPAQSSGNRIVLAGADGVIRSYQAQNGNSQWQTPLPEESLDLKLTDTHIVSSQRDSTAALDAETGKVLWQTEARDLIALNSNSVLTEGRREVEALKLSDGTSLWKSSVLQSPVVRGQSAFLVTGERGQPETLEARNLDTGELQWSTTDGDIKHVVVGPESILYSNQKIGKHHETVQFVTNRSPEGEILWTHKCDGRLRAEPKFSPDGTRVAIHEIYPADPSRSFVTILSTESGEPVTQAVAGHDLDVTFLSKGRVAVGETDYNLIPGQGESRLRVINADGSEAWSSAGRPQWMMGGSAFLAFQDGQLRCLDESDGSARWQRAFEGELAPVSNDGSQAGILQKGCGLLTIDLASGETKDNFKTGHQLLLSSENSQFVTDHEGRVAVHNLPDDGQDFRAGSWEMPVPFHMPFLSGPAERQGKPAVFVDWDGDEADDGRDPILVDGQNNPVSWAQLSERDKEEDATLETGELEDLKLWFDVDRDGKVSSDNELKPLVKGGSFDKGRMLLSENELWLASGSRCENDPS